MYVPTATSLALSMVAALLSLASPALAQSTAKSSSDLPDQWNGLVPAALTTVFVRDTSGTDTTGKLLELSRDSLTILVGQHEQRFDLATVTGIQKRDSLKNGTIAGAVVGVVMGVISSSLADCSGSGHSTCPGFRVAMVALSTGVYAGLGAGIDALIPGRTTIYSARPTSSARFTRPAPAQLSMVRLGMSW
jgi:hypothetical protein